MGQLRALASLHSTAYSSFTTLATTTHNKKYLAEWVQGNKRLCREIASDEASKKTSLTQL
jgi:hypothetical protein